MTIDIRGKSKLLGIVIIKISLLDIFAVIFCLRVQEWLLLLDKEPFLLGSLLEDIECLPRLLELCHEGLGGLFRAQRLHVATPTSG